MPKLENFKDAKVKIALVLQVLLITNCHPAVYEYTMVGEPFPTVDYEAPEGCFFS